MMVWFATFKAMHPTTSVVSERCCDQYIAGSSSLPNALITPLVTSTAGTTASRATTSLEELPERCFPTFPIVMPSVSASCLPLPRGMVPHPPQSPPPPQNVDSGVVVVVAERPLSVGSKPQSVATF
ncbi:hypothetical protein Acr_17g0000760 [Actinidia rufa]|uniref:Uncharacterized protein n=1 Tax=Actinidia rufa TaxID=165716 RepID=A0A7J0G0V2_9ERIC|nr:hypothetical protein Acr_17g0000760 [Actinidia rufa]